MIVSGRSPFLTISSRSVTLNGQERLGTFDPERSNAFERSGKRSRFKNERNTVNLDRKLAKVYLANPYSPLLGE
jgi:hypothetical protein